MIIPKPRSSSSARGAQKQKQRTLLSFDRLECRELLALTIPTVSATAGYAYSATIATLPISDVQGVSLANLSATITWGDNTTNDVPLTALGANSYAIVGSHVYTTANNYTLGVNVKVLGSGVVSGTNVSNVVAPLAPALVATPTIFAAQVGVNAPNVFAASFSDASTPALAAGSFNAVINWGDNQTSIGTITGPTSGVFQVAGTHTYATTGTNGQFTVSTTITRLTDSKAVIATGTAVVSPTPALTPGAAATFNTVVGMVANIPLVATFTDATNPALSATSFTAVTNWGDGQSSVGTITGISAGLFQVAGTHTYATTGTNGQFTVSTTITRLTDSKAVTVSATAVVSLPAPTIAGAPGTFTAVAGLLASKVLVATFTDPGTSALTSASYRAFISWGDGQTSIGEISGPTNGVFEVTHDHTYVATGAAPGQNGTYTVSTVVTRVTDSQSNTATATATVIPQVSGSIFGLNAGAISNNRPLIQGTATPYAFVRLTAIGPGVLGTLILGQTVADPIGNWNLQTGPLADGLYTITATANSPAGFPEQSALIGPGGQLIVDTIGPQVVSVGYDRLLNQLVIVTRDVGVGMSLPGSGLSNPANFAITGPSRRVNMGLVIYPSSVTAQNVATNDPTLVRTVISLSSRLGLGHYNLRIAAWSITDRVGNALRAPNVIAFTVANSHKFPRSSKPRVTR